MSDASTPRPEHRIPQLIGGGDAPPGTPFPMTPGPNGVPVVAPAPSPVSTVIGVVESNDGRLVQVEVFTCTGRAFLFFPAEDAENFAAGLKEAARVARTGIVRANGSGLVH